MSGRTLIKLLTWTTLGHRKSENVVFFYAHRDLVYYSENYKEKANKYNLCKFMYIE